MECLSAAKEMRQRGRRAMQRERGSRLLASADEVAGLYAGDVLPGNYPRSTNQNFRAAGDSESIGRETAGLLFGSDDKWNRPRLPTTGRRKPQAGQAFQPQSIRSLRRHRRDK